MAKILIVDDDVETTTLLEGIIKMGGHEPHSINESKHALKAVEDTMPALILLDIMMAEINGIALCKLIKSDPAITHIPVVIISALSDEGTKKDASNAGANDFITKPIHPKNLLRRIEQILNE
ncbi:MAG: response regulator [Anaerolineaceae bacterium]|jgi:CheY-like chemotaxis protein|nr:MAG: response regulator [Anaerolineaceae bacterium]